MPVSRCLLVDLDGVVRTWDARYAAAVEARHGLAEGSIATAAFADELALLEALTGRITDVEWRAGIAECLSELCDEAAAIAAVAEWSAPAGEVDVEVLDCLRRARKAGWRIGLLTNATTRLREDLDRLGLLGEFDAVISSAELGIAKPEAAAFERACAAMGVADPSQCVFVDDSADNVAAAITMGMDAHVFRGARWLARLLGVPEAE